MATRTGRVVLVLGLAAAIAAGVSVMRGRLGPDASQFLARAQADYQAGRLDQAQAALERLARMRDPTPMDRMARALVAQARGELDRALDELARVGPDARLAPMAELRAGQIEVDRGHLRRAERHLLAALEQDPGLAPARNRLAYIYNVQLRLDEMDAQMDELSRLGHLDFDSLLHWSKTRNVTWNPAADCEVLARAVAADPDDRRSRLALIDGLLRLGRRDEAEAVLAPLPDTDPDARARRGLLALDRGDEARAERLLREGPPDHPGLAGLRGRLALRRGDPRAALASLRIALAANPDDRALQGAMATALRLIGDEPGARRLLDAARRHDELTPVIAYAATPAGKGDPRLPARMGAACEAAGRLAEARAWFRLAIARDPLDAAAQQAVFRLERRQPTPAHR